MYATRTSVFCGPEPYRHGVWLLWTNETSRQNAPHMSAAAQELRSRVSHQTIPTPLLHHAQRHRCSCPREWFWLGDLPWTGDRRSQSFEIDDYQLSFNHVAVFRHQRWYFFDCIWKGNVCILCFCINKCRTFFTLFLDNNQLFLNCFETSKNTIPKIKTNCTIAWRF